IMALQRLARAYSQRGDYARAEPLYLKDLELTRKVWGEAHVEYALALTHLSYFYDERGAAARAAALHRECLDVTRRTWELAATGRSQRQQLSLAQSLRWRLDEYISAAPRAGLIAEEVYPYVLAWKGTVLDRQRWDREQRRILQDRRPEVARNYAALQQVT